MNAALVGILRDWMSDSDAKRDKEDERKYREAQKLEGRKYEEGRTEESRKYSKGEKIEGREYEEKKHQQNRVEGLEDSFKQADQSYRQALGKFNNAWPHIQSAFPDGTTPEQAFELTGKSGSMADVEKYALSRESLMQGAPKSKVSAGVAGDRATSAEAANRETVATVARPRLGEEVVSAQNARILSNRMAGDPDAASSREFYTSIGPDGVPTVVRNPMGAEIAAARKGETGLGAYGADPLLATLPQVQSITPYEKKLDAYGRPVAVQSTPTPVARPTVGAPTNAKPPMTSWDAFRQQAAEQEQLAKRATSMDRTAERQAAIEDQQKSVISRAALEYEQRRRNQPTQLIWPQ